MRLKYAGLISVLAIILIACSLPGQIVNIDATIDAAVVATLQAGVNIQGTVDAAVMATRQAQQQVSEAVPASALPVTPIPNLRVSSPVDIERVQLIIDNEVNATAAQNLPILESIYAPNAKVTDHNGTPYEFGDDTVWRGWANIQRRYQTFFSSGVSSIALVGLSIQVDGDHATAIHQGVVLDGVLHPDTGIYSLTKIDDQWLITGLNYGNRPSDSGTSVPVDENGTAFTLPDDNALYDLKVGSQHGYEQPWGWDRGDPCIAWDTNNFDDTKPYYRGFNVELLLTNNSNNPVPDNWPISFLTANGKSVKACYYGYKGAGPPPGTTSSVTFFTVVDQGDYVSKITFGLEGQPLQLCLDGQGGWWRC